MSHSDQVAYTVIATLPTTELAAEYVDWLRGGHVQAVMVGGALSAQVLMHDPAQERPFRKVEARYVFDSRAALDRYIGEFAPALRAEGLARWGSVPGITFERTVGVIQG